MSNPPRNRSDIPRTLVVGAVLAVLSVFSPPGSIARGDVVINEIFYNQPGPIETLEFVELLNTGTETVALVGWRLSGGVDFTFRDGVTIESGGFLLITASLAEFLEAHPGRRIAGVYEGRLRNSGERLEIVNSDGVVIDEVRYDDDPDWPLEADGEGASLELRDPEKPHDVPGNWGPGDPPTPGAPNRSTSETPEIQAWDLRVRPRAVTSNDEVTIRARVYGENPVRRVAARVLVDGQTTEVDMLDDGVQPDDVAGDGEYAAGLGRFPNRTLGKAKVLVVDSAGTEHVWPQHVGPPGDDEADWHAWFVYDGDIETKAPVVWLFLSEEKLRVLARNAQVRSFSDPRFVNFDESFDAFVVFEGEVHRKVAVRHRGGFASRHAARLKYSWRFELPGWDDYHGRQNILIIGNMHWDDRWMRGDNGLQDKLGYMTFDRAGVPSSRTRFIRLMVNGEFFGYHVEVEAVDGQFLERNGFTGLGDLYKHGRTFQAHHFPLATSQYPRAYNKKTGDRSDYTSIRRFCEDLATATRGGPPSIRRYLPAATDLDEYRRFLTAIALCTHWDSTNNNIQIYRNDLDEDRWVRFPWDLDISWGYSRRKPPPTQGHNLHPYDGSSSNPQPNEFGLSALRQAYLRVPEFRAEFGDSLADALVTYFTETEIHPVVDRILEQDGQESQADIDKWNGLDGTWNWFPFEFHARYDKNYVSSRRKFLAEFLDREPLLSQASVTPRPAGPRDELTFIVNALGSRFDGVHDLGPGNLASVKLHLSIGGEASEWDMTHVDRRVNDFFRVTVPAPNSETRIWYRFSAVDDEEREGFLPDPERHGYEYFVLDVETSRPEPGDLRLSEIMYRSAHYDVEFVELRNNLWRAVDITGWRLMELEQDGDENEFTFPGGSIIDAQGYLVASRNTRAVFEFYNIVNVAAADLPFSLDNGGSTLILLDATGNVIDVVNYDDDAPWPESADGEGPSLERVDATSEVAGAEAWAASAAQGTPGRPNSVSDSIVPPQPGDEPPERPLFHRGDADGSGSLDLSDAVRVLGFLFLGTTTPGCLETADANNDGTIDLADPVGVLGYLFLQGSPPRPPGPPGNDCGADPDPVGSAGDLGCNRYARCQ